MTRAKAIKPPYVQGPFRARGRLYCFFRKPGSERIPLPLPLGSDEFWSAYRAALAEAPGAVEIGASRTKPGTLDALIVAYYKSAEFLHALSPATQAYRRNIIERFRAPRGDRPVKLFEKRHVAAILETMQKPHARKAWLKAIRGLMKYAMQIGMISADPSRDIKLAKMPKSGGHRTWSEVEIEAYRATHPLGTRPRLALELLVNTVQRRGDVVRMGRQHVRNGRIYVKQRKTGVELSLPVLPELAEAIAAMPNEHLTFMVTISGKPFADASFGNWFRDLRRRDDPDGFHGGRCAVCGQAESCRGILRQCRCGTRANSWPRHWRLDHG
jgi:integrase